MRKNHIFVKDYSSRTLICDISDAKNDILASTEIALRCDFQFVRKQPLKIASSSNERFLAPTFFFLLRREIFFLFPSVVFVSKELFSSSFGSGLASIRARKRVSPSSRANGRRRYPTFAGIEQLNIFLKKKKIITFY